MIKIGAQEIDFIKFFESKTGATVKDCIINESITVIVKEGDVGLAIGKQGVVINDIKKKVGKEIHVHEYSEDPSVFIAKLFHPVRVEKVEIDGARAVVVVDPDEKKRAIGRGGKKIEAVKALAKRHFGIEEIRIS